MGPSLQTYNYSAAGAGYSDDVDSWYPLPEEEEDTKEDDDGIKEEENTLLTILISALALRTPINHQAIKESGERGEEGHDDLFNDEEEGGGEEEEEEMDTNPLVDSETQRELLNALDELEKILREEEKYMGI
ncbi:hypothetical protein EMWEY_00009420 [Eimeria maxima]|uniref:Uncharacterized protein n=1 Tax=Eimeria maxima TaxID=5804 RepID=U6MDU6_EIMMA|nr:hypothetical protein EMWEY_00009420 [Eimeria maxima]CDJ61228.1 hypothetical protein EMWEY_00009420 [Eimeria maxima]